ncbi:hypothetical protein DPEC_G00349380 [Dallia pectoralis]|uniref:Uncharacterized protein n=1 Tax=Dallia pectoralis TaxID=75939 RepID=A0ACC2F199_DALPE|nr:hypothetical protein DPEC_G00349380 [Dallia pectoralis]
MERELRLGNKVNGNRGLHHEAAGTVSNEEMESGGKPSPAKRPRLGDVTADSTGERDDISGEVAQEKETGGPAHAEVMATLDCTCPICGFVAKTPTALKIHSKRKHTGKGKSRSVSSAKVHVEIDVRKTGATAHSSNDEPLRGTEEKLNDGEREKENAGLQSLGAEDTSGEVTTKNNENIAENKEKECLDQEIPTEATGGFAEEQPEPTPIKRDVGKQSSKPKTMHSCSYCGHEFRDKPSLDTHIKRRHTKEMNHFCEFCSYACVANNEHAVQVVEVSGTVFEEDTETQVTAKASEQIVNEAPDSSEVIVPLPGHEQTDELAPEPMCSDDDAEVAEKQLIRAQPFDACIVPLKSLTDAQLALHEERMAHIAESDSGQVVSGPTGSPVKTKRSKPAGASGLSRGVTPNPRIRCDDCGFVADGLSGLNVHISMKHPSKEKHFHCMLCGKSFYTESNLQQHLTSAAHQRNEQASIEELPEGGATFKCVKCTDPFETEQELFMHIKEKHEELLREVNKYVLEDTEQINREREENQGNVCKHCGKVCKSSNSMAFLAHVRTHTGSKPFKCKICNFATAQLGDARNHVRRHLGMREYKCHICG